MNLKHDLRKWQKRARKAWLECGMKGIVEAERSARPERWPATPQGSYSPA